VSIPPEGIPNDPLPRRPREDSGRPCWLTGLWQFDLTEPPADAAYVCPMGEMVLLHPDMIRAAHAAGRTVFAWWGALESPATDAILEAYGVDGIMVDDLRPLD
jgi:glycerophosphoryl diester phosphodiesterase